MKNLHKRVYDLNELVHSGEAFCFCDHKGNMQTMAPHGAIPCRLGNLPSWPRTAYNQFWTERLGALVSIWEIDGTPGVMLGFSFKSGDGGGRQEDSLVETQRLLTELKKKWVLEQAAAAFARWLAHNVPEPVEVYSATETDGVVVSAFIPCGWCDEFLGRKCCDAAAHVKAAVEHKRFLLYTFTEQAAQDAAKAGFPLPLTIAIDGPAAAGKTTQAKALAAQLGLTYYDTGSLYRTVAVGVMDALGEVDVKDNAITDKIGELLPSFDIRIENENGKSVNYLNGMDVTSRLRTEAVSKMASDVSALPSVRRFLLGMQQAVAQAGNVVMEGRDIGTVVMPDALVKIYMTASVDNRAQRRVLELRKRGETVDLPDVMRDMLARDNNDSSRKEAPLKQAPDATFLDNSELDIHETTDAIMAIIADRLSACVADDYKHRELYRLLYCAQKASTPVKIVERVSRQLGASTEETVQLSDGRRVTCLVLYDPDADIHQFYYDLSANIKFLHPGWEAAK